MADLSDDELVEVILQATRAIVGVAIRSLPNRLTLHQFRALVVLAAGRPLRLYDLAVALGVSPSSGTRMCDRLVRQQLITRARDEVDRREVVLSLTPAGRQVVDDVIEQRRAAFRAMVGVIPNREREQMAFCLNLLAEAAGELPETAWSQGWGTESAAS